MNHSVGIFGLGAAFAVGISNAGEMGGRSDAQLLKVFAVSQCIARAYPNSQVSEDAKAAAGGYLEFGHVPVDRYGEAIVLAEKALKQTYQSKDGKKLQVMKCIDLMFDPALEALSLKANQ